MKKVFGALVFLFLVGCVGQQVHYKEMQKEVAEMERLDKRLAEVRYERDTVQKSEVLEVDRKAFLVDSLGMRMDELEQAYILAKQSAEEENQKMYEKAQLINGANGINSDLDPDRRVPE